MVQYLNKIIKFSRINVIGIIKKEGADIYHVLTLLKRGTTLNILDSRSFDDFEKLLKTTDIKIPVILVMDGKGILHKKIDNEKEEDLNWLKTIDFANIYYTTFQYETIGFMSFCRNEQVDEKILFFQTNHFQVLDVYIGAFPVAFLKNHINTNIVKAGPLELIFEGNELESFVKNDKTTSIQIGQDNLLSTHLPLYASAIHFFLQPEEITKTENKINLEELIFQKAFTKLGLTMLVSFFVLLLISYTSIQYFNRMITELNLEVIYSNQSYKQIKALEKRREQQLVILNESGLTSNIFISHYISDLLLTIPKSIKLSELNYAPIDKETKINKKILMTPNVILVKGQTNEEGVFNNWLINLKRLRGIRKFEVVNLKKDKKNISQFEVKILLNHV
ncbi:hypothetical protein B0A78_11570 [Flavobacterium columnare NBRC 100251 = ATCC 23463]|uniref:Uncharacterized protein n=1 Tax=Flavobacterium columnare (strain ATCC 49512 / CIP 103533 / TG 44/87) TaxID=1041826 RepID=G8X4Y0_FLACA|nr:hypothetical protein [Flavobacterium columnare]AEW86796.1 hypothetical protein FCOL_09935 [Flavobacterium columnare ATCC 49512]ANO47218.1 hypothetical protein Pf1_01761 [Flavobacterium columnare]APT22110.1 hypothetical protein BU993_05365 [Flavobacterium columnare]MBF6652894.1 hypothetical protein [Flavobacterium columnare]MBF6656418.1 hypothetical protein [Flavobacterium columnare]